MMNPKSLIPRGTNDEAFNRLANFAPAPDEAPERLPLCKATSCAMYATCALLDIDKLITLAHMMDCEYIEGYDALMAFVVQMSADDQAWLLEQFKRLDTAR